jgi:hypothetical protein
MKNTLIPNELSPTHYGIYTVKESFDQIAGAKGLSLDLWLEHQTRVD